MNQKNLPRISFLDFLPINGVGAELGVFKGEFSKELIDKTNLR